MKISEFSINHPVTATMAVLSVIALGLLSLNRIPLIFLPDVSRPYLRVSVSYQGSNPEEVERLITRPIEEIMGTVPGIKTISSTSSSSFSSVRMEFEEGRDMDIAAMEVRERLDRIRNKMPRDLLDQPRVTRWSTTDWPILNFGVVWKGDPDRFESIVENVLEKRLMALDGVANVSIEGLKKKSIYIDLNDDLMRSSRINPYQLSSRISRDNENLPAGYVYTGGKKYNIRVIGQFQSVDEIGRLPLNQRGLRLEQVADVRLDYPKRIRWIQRLNGHDAVSMGIFKTSNANIIDVNRRVIKALDEIKADPRYADFDYQIYWNQSEEILNSIDTLKKSGFIGGILAILILYFFLGNFRNTLVIAIAIPVSIICTLFIMYLVRLEPFDSDLTLNIISMMGMIYAIGIVVDPSIVVLENIFRIRNEEGLNPVAASLEGSREVGLPILASVLTNIIVFAPLIFLGGGRGGMRFMADFGITFIAVCVASFIVAISVVPLLCARMIRHLQPNKERSFPGMKNFFTYLVDQALRYRAATMLIVVAILLGVFMLQKLIDREPGGMQMDRRLNISAEISHNYGMEEAEKIMKGIEADLLAHKEELEISSVGLNLSMGRRNRAGIQIYFQEATKNSRTITELQEAIKGRLPEIPGFTWRTARWHGHGRRGDLEIALIGEKMELLATYAKRVETLMQDLPGVKGINVSTEEGEQEVRIVVNRDRAASSGISATQVARTVSSQLSSRPISRFKAPEREIDIQLGLAEEDRLNLQGLETMTIFSPTGQQRELKNLAEIEIGRGPRSIEKTGRLYRVEVDLDTGGGGIYMLSHEVMARMSEIKFAPGYSWELGRSFQAMMEEESQSRFAIILALVLIYILLASLFESFIHPFTILLSVPFAIIGVAIIFIATNINLGTVAYIGVIIVCGLVVNNSIILVDYINLLRARGLSRREAIIAGVQKRLRPILMTAATTILSLLPMTAPLLAPALFGPAEGRSAHWGPVGLAILGGLTTSTFLTLIITPTLYTLFDDLALGTKSILARVFGKGTLNK